MSQSKGQAFLIGSLMLMAIGQSARAAVETIPSSTIPPPPGELRLSFPNPPPPSFNRAELHFFGPVRSNSSPTLTAVTFRFDWTLPSGEQAFSEPVSYGLEPGRSTLVDTALTVDGCPSFVSLDFMTTSSSGATASGTFEHTCFIPEPKGIASFGLLGILLLLLGRR